MKVPVLRLKDILLTSLQRDLIDQEMLDFQSDLLRTLVKTRASGVVIDITALDTIDSFMARLLNDTANMVRLLGADVVLCGMQPQVALTLVEMGRELIGVETALNLEQGLEKLQFRRREQEETARD